MCQAVAVGGEAVYCSCCRPICVARQTPFGSSSDGGDERTTGEMDGWTKRGRGPVVTQDEGLGHSRRMLDADVRLQL
jgi:hypothetical protein